MNVSRDLRKLYCTLVIATVYWLNIYTFLRSMIDVACMMKWIPTPRAMLQCSNKSQVLKY